ADGSGPRTKTPETCRSRADSGAERCALLHREPAGILAPLGRRWDVLVLRCALEADAPPDLRARVRRGRRGEDRDDAQGFQPVAEHTVDLRAGVGLPWFCRFE